MLNKHDLEFIDLNRQIKVLCQNNFNIQNFSPKMIISLCFMRVMIRLWLTRKTPLL